MARKKKTDVNVLAAIREHWKANADIGPTTAAEAISKQIGKKVTPTYVSNIKTLMNGKSKNNGRKRRKANGKARRLAPVARAHANGTVELATISIVKDLLGYLEE